KKVLKDRGLATGLGDEGGFAPDLPSNREALDLIMQAIEKAGYTPGAQVALALDVASTEFFTDGRSTFEGNSISAAELTKYYEQLVDDTPRVSPDDPLYVDDESGRA